MTEFLELGYPIYVHYPSIVNTDRRSLLLGNLKTLQAEIPGTGGQDQEL